MKTYIDNVLIEFESLPSLRKDYHTWNAKTYHEVRYFIKTKLQQALDQQKEKLIKKLEGEKKELMYSNERIRLETLENPVFAVVTFPKLTIKLAWKNDEKVVRKEITEIVENHEISREITRLSRTIDDEFESKVYDATVYKWSDFNRDINGSPNVPDNEELYYNKALDRAIELIKESK